MNLPPFVSGLIQSYDSKSQTATVVFIYMTNNYTINIPVSDSQAHAGVTVNSRCIINIVDPNNLLNSIIAYTY